MNRRQFLGAAGAAGAAAAVRSYAREDMSALVPYAIPPGNDVQPGVTAVYATVCRECPAGCGMLARVRDGRAFKLEGNPDHPVNQGRLCIRGQAALQGLYNPDRITQPLVRGSRGGLQPAPWDQAIPLLQDAVRAAAGRPAAWIGRLDTGAFDRLVDAWLGALFPTHTRLRFEPFAYEPLRAAAGRVLGQPGVPEFAIADANMLLSFGADFLQTWVSNVQYTRDFADWRAARVAGRHRGRFVWIAPHLSLTGANADEWIRIRPGTEGLVAQALASLAGGPAADVGALAAAAGVQPSTLERIGREFMAQTPSLALPLDIAGTDRNAAAAEEAILRLNTAAGAVGRTILLGRPHALSAASSFGDMLGLIRAMQGGGIGVAFLHHANPAYTLPPGSGFAEALARVPAVISFSPYVDETMQYASLVLPDLTPLESWGEYTPRPGITGLMQPVMEPVFDARPTGDVLLESAAALGRNLGAATFREYLRSTYSMDEPAWVDALQRGGLFAAAAGAAPGAPAASAGPSPGTGAPVPTPGAGAGAPAPGAGAGSVTAAPAGGGAAPGFATPPAGSAAPGLPLAPVLPPAGQPADQVAAGPIALSLRTYPSLHFFDGRLANRPWAQEIPEPLTKVVWGSWVEIHPDTAARLGAREGDVLVLQNGRGRLEVPAIVSDRVHPNEVAMMLGQGHTLFGRYATGIGVNPVLLLPPEADPASGAMIRSGVQVDVSRLPKRRQPIVLQTSFSQNGINIAREVTLSELATLQRPEYVPLPGMRPARPSLYRNPLRGPHHWGMVIDLDRCIGCDACAAACYAENNVPIVGPAQCKASREMAWLFIQRYGDNRERAGEPGAVQIGTRFFPMLCQQCMNAPCEYVCPVYATMHDDQGLNEQVYNRCVGTRFCSNNCPYKVRRFNWFTFEFTSPLDQHLNPDVIHRKKGVMEKCTFCIQRIRRHEIEAKAEGRPLRDGEIQTACQQTCPANAIIFGDLQDPNSAVRRAMNDARGYGALADLNTYPNIVYQARVRAT